VEPWFSSGLEELKHLSGRFFGIAVIKKLLAGRTTALPL
jgi:hypothetical protein